MGVQSSKTMEYKRRVSQVKLTYYEKKDSENVSVSLDTTVLSSNDNDIVTCSLDTTDCSNNHTQTVRCSLDHNNHNEIVKCLFDTTDHSTNRLGTNRNYRVSRRKSSQISTHTLTVISTTNENRGRNCVYRRAISEISVTCYEEPEPDDSEPSFDTNDDEHNQRDTNLKYTRGISQLTVTCFEETGDEDGVKKRTYCRTVSQMSVACYRKSKVKTCNQQNKSGESRKGGKEKKYERQKTQVTTQDGTIEVYRSAKGIAEYCLPLVTAHFAGQTTSSIHTDISADENGTLHLGVYLQVMDAYLRHFKKAEEFTGTEEFYLKLLRYIARKRRLANETEDECYDRLLCDSKRFVQIYHKRGGFSQPIKEHKDYWGSRQQLLSGKVIADWVDQENGPIDPIFGVLLQPTTGRAGPGDAGLFHQVMFDGNGHVAYHSAVHDAFGYLINFHNIGPGYDYMHDSKFGTANPLAGQIDGMGFWKNVLKKEELKPHIMDLTTGTLGILPILNHQVKGSSVYL